MSEPKFLPYIDSNRIAYKARVIRKQAYPDCFLYRIEWATIKNGVPEILVTTDYMLSKEGKLNRYIGPRFQMNSVKEELYYVWILIRNWELDQKHIKKVLYTRGEFRLVKA